MKIIIDKELQKGDYILNFVAENLPNDEFELAVSRFNYPRIDFGGVFTEVVNTETVEVFKFNQNLRDLTKDLPYVRTFKSAQYGVNTEKFANIYAIEMEKRINDALDELRSKVDNFSDNDIVIYY